MKIQSRLESVKLATSKLDDHYQLKFICCERDTIADDSIPNDECNWYFTATDGHVLISVKTTLEEIKYFAQINDVMECFNPDAKIFCLPSSRKLLKECIDNNASSVVYPNWRKVVPTKPIHCEKVENYFKAESLKDMNKAKTILEGTKESTFYPKLRGSESPNSAYIDIGNDWIILIMPLYFKACDEEDAASAFNRFVTWADKI